MLCWGLPASPDPVLYYVRGFDPSSRRFEYAVNPRFGDSRPQVTASSQPFRVSIDISLGLTGNIQNQQAAYYLRPLRSAPGRRAPADSILARIRSTGASALAPYYWLLQNADSLLLSPEQYAALVDANARYQRMVDSTWMALATDLAAVPDEFDPAGVLARISKGQRDAFAVAREFEVVGGILNPIQLRLVPEFISRGVEQARKNPAGTPPRPP